MTFTREKQYIPFDERLAFAKWIDNLPMTFVIYTIWRTT